MNPEFWFSEKYSETCKFTFKVKIVLETKESEFQRLDILDTYDFGRVMLLDGLVMLTERDEFVYHEMITNIALFAHPEPKDVLVIGGGDGGTVRELAKHRYLNSITEVEIDRIVVDGAKKYMPFVGCGYDNELVNLIIGDGIEFVKNKSNAYDIVIIDSTDPFGPAEGLFSGEFYKNVKNALRNDGYVVAQAENPYYDTKWMMRSVNNMKKAFHENVECFLAYIPTYPSGMWNFAMGYKNKPASLMFDEERYNNLNLNLKYYNKDIHKASFALPEFVKRLLNE
jgi:spermidine synthase